MKRKVNINRPEISSAEILKRKNFDSVLKQSAAIGGAKPLIKKPWFLSSVVAVTIAVVTTVVLMNKNSTSQPIGENQEQLSDSDSLALQAFYKEQEAKPCIAPPIPGLNVEYTSYKVIAEKGAILDFKTGSKITIPKNAFTDEKGNVLKGEIELRYREFHDAVDFFVAGIPMTYDSAGVRYHFESAGMIEILAYQNGKKVNVAPEKEIAIEMASTDSDPRFNLYKLDTMANNWSCLGKDKVLTKSEGIKGSKSTEVQATKVEQTPEYVTLETKKVEAKKEKEVEMAMLPKPISEPLKPETVHKGKFVLSFEVKYNDFPELASFKDVAWEIGDENKNFDEAKYKYITKEDLWDNATIKEGPKKGENYIIALTSGSKLKENLVVYPVLEGKNYETAMKTYQDKFSKYKTTLDKRIAEEKRVEEVYQAKIAEIQRRQEEMVRQIEKREVDQYKQMETSLKVMRAFTVSSFGVYNSDCAQKYPKGVLCTASLKNDLNKNLVCYEVYLVDKERNALFTYNRNPVINFSFNPASKNMLWTVENGVLYWLKPAQFATMNGSNGTTDLVLTKVDQQFSTADELKTYLGF
ncbi:hypothetical protein BH10BAC1_BH10BAC1_17410 [soil metagenome]